VRIVIHLRTLPYPPNPCTRPSLPYPQRHRAVPCGGIFAETPVPLTWVRQTLETLENSWRRAMTPLGEAFEELVVDLQYGFEAVAPREVDGRGVRVL
jgi:hypothetical protein